MKKLILMVIAVAVFCWSIPKPMESITNYNVMMVHGAYGSKNSEGKLQGFEPGDYSQAIDTTDRMGAATMGGWPSGEKSTVVMEVVSAKARHILPAKMFNVE